MDAKRLERANWLKDRIESCGYKLACAKEELDFLKNMDSNQYFKVSISLFDTKQNNVLPAQKAIHERYFQNVAQDLPRNYVAGTNITSVNYDHVSEPDNRQSDFLRSALIGMYETYIQDETEFLREIEDEFGSM